MILASIYRATARAFCNMELSSYPFDVQVCPLTLVSCKSYTLICSENMNIIPYYEYDLIENLLYSQVTFQNRFPRLVLIIPNYNTKLAILPGNSLR